MAWVSRVAKLLESYVNETKSLTCDKNITLSARCSLCATPYYSMEQAVSSVVDEQSPNALDADRDSVEEFVLLFHSSYISV